MSARFCRLAIACIALAAMMFLGHTAYAQNVTRQQLQQLAPSESDLAGFARLQLSNAQPSQDATGADSDFVNLNQDVTQWAPGRDATPNRTGTVSRLARKFSSTSGLYEVRIDITVCDTSDAAKHEVLDFRQGTQAIYIAGAFNSPQIGDESWVAMNRALLCRSGRLVFLVSGDRTPFANKVENVRSFPPSAIEAIAYQILLRASQQAYLTGGSTQAAQLTVNGHALPGNALLVGKQTYVPVQAFAKAMGLTSGWNAKTGALTLSGPKRKTVALTAGSTAATVGGAKAAALTVPVLKDGGEPVMALSDLLTLTGGRVTSHDGNTVQVKG